MHSDHPTLHDRLGRLHSIVRKARRLMECDPPQTFGVHGDWGSGKTSFLRQLRYHLDGSTEACKELARSELPQGHYADSVVTIWFDAWRYQHEAVPVIALLHEMRRQFSTAAYVRGKAAKLTEVTIISILNGLDDIGKLLKFEAAPVLSPKRIVEAGEKWEREHLEARLGTDSIQSFLEQAVHTLLEALLARRDGVRLIVFIDDLDRCSPESCYRLLEGLKVYLSLRNCVFIIGMNQQLIVDAIAPYMPKDFGPADQKLKESAVRVRAEAYLEKFCTDIERLAPPMDARALVCSWIDDEGYRESIRAALTHDGSEVKCLPPNPRRLKALANLLNRWRDIVQHLGEPNDLIAKHRAAVVISYIYQFHSEIFQRWQYSASFYSYLEGWALRSLGKEWPPYFKVLALPERLDSDPNSPTPEGPIQSNYPDPYSADMFWIAPLMRVAKLREIDVAPVMAAITTSAAAF